MQHAYRYAPPSQIVEGTAPKLSLATAADRSLRYPYFFEGRVRQPRLVADLLTAVHLIVGSRFYTPPGMLGRILSLADPVVTSGGGLLRFEAFSSCCGAYIRADLLPESYEGDVVGKGTTNVDFNSPMRAALARVRDDASLAFAIGQDEVTLRSAGAEVTERKVELPERWIRGMPEVQSYRAGMKRRLEASTVEALRVIGAAGLAGYDVSPAVTFIACCRSTCRWWRTCIRGLRMRKPCWTRRLSASCPPIPSKRRLLLAIPRKADLRAGRNWNLRSAALYEGDPLAQADGSSQLPAAYTSAITLPSIFP